MSNIEKSKNPLEELYSVKDCMDYISEGNRYFHEYDEKIEEFLESFFERYEKLTDEIATFETQEAFLDYIQDRYPDYTGKSINKGIEYLQFDLRKDLPIEIRFSLVPRLGKIFDEKIKNLRKNVKKLPTEVGHTQNAVKEHSLRICPEELALIEKQLNDPSTWQLF